MNSFKTFWEIFDTEQAFNLSTQTFLDSNKIVFKVPGLKASDLKLELTKDNWLKVTGESKNTGSKTKQTVKLANKPLSYKDLSAYCADGLLTVEINWPDAQKEDVVEIPIRG